MDKTLAYVFALFVGLSPAQFFESNSRAQEQHPAFPTTAQCEETIKKVTPSIVQIIYDDSGTWAERLVRERKLRLGCGVIVSKDGHVAVNSSTPKVADERLLELRLADGRKVKAKALGSSSEFGAGMLKIVEQGEWPFVKLSNNVNVNQVCVAMGFHRDYDGTSNPGYELDLVTRVSKGNWFTTARQSDFGSHPIFNINGELLGMNTSSGEDQLYSSASRIEEFWNELDAGLNIDRTRLISDVKPKSLSETLPATMIDEAFSKAKAASVQIFIELGTEKSFSGVIVPDGYIVTCAHHRRPTGTQLFVQFSDGRVIDAEVMGVDWLTDVSVLKITDKGEWPSVELGYSSVVQPGTRVTMIGYPIESVNKPLIIDTQIISPTQTLKTRDAWYDELWLARDEKTIENLRGASGSGIFDTSGNLIGILWASVGNEMRVKRVELFHKNWTKLTSPDNKLETIDPQLQSETSKSLKRLISDLKNSKQKL